jgi:DNA adenine methylase
MRNNKTLNTSSILKPFVKWPGGKSRELKYIIPNLPSTINNFYEPFVGGGSVYFAVEANSYYINDKSTDLINLFKIIVDNNEQDSFFSAIRNVNLSWSGIEQLFNSHEIVLTAMFSNLMSDTIDEIKLKEAIGTWVADNLDDIDMIFSSDLYQHCAIFHKELKKNLFRKIKQMKKIELKKNNLSATDISMNLLTALKSSVYMYYRYLLNNPLNVKSLDSAVYYFIRTFTYSSMFRFNEKGEFNVPYGGMGYNRNSLVNKLAYIQSEGLQSRLKNTSIENKDFTEFVKDKEFGPHDFIFLDPPYDSDFSTYDKNVFGKSEQEKLADFLINDVKCKWMVVIKNTEMIFSLYSKIGVYINSFDKNYSVSFMARNDTDVEHLIITNYDISDNKQAHGVEEVELLLDPEENLDDNTTTLGDYAGGPIENVLDCSNNTKDDLMSSENTTIDITPVEVTPAVYQLTKDTMNVIYIPVPRVYPVKKRKAYLKEMSDTLTEKGYENFLIPILDD